MDPLENRLERLTPEQRRSVEDYIDFLLHRSGEQPPGQTVTPPASSPLDAAPPPLFSAPEILVPDPQAVRAPPRNAGTGQSQPFIEPDPAPLHVQEISSETEDARTAGYMDYGKFEKAEQPSPSPADEAVQRVRVRMSTKKTQDPARNVLDWIE